MKGLSFTILPMGYLEHDESISYAGKNIGTVANKHPQAVWERVPVMAVLFRHPTAGYILYDTGNCPGDEKDRLSQAMRNNIYFDIKREDFIDYRLGQLGLTPADIDMLILSHSHHDHNGGLGFFSFTKAGRNVITYEKDYVNALKETHQFYDKEDYVFIKENMHFDGISYQLIEGDQELVEGIEAIELPGHTPAVLGLVVHLENETVIFPSDAVYTAKNYGPPAIAPGIVYDSLGSQKSVEKLRRLQRKYNARIIFPHDLAQFETLEKCPTFYK